MHKRNDLQALYYTFYICMKIAYVRTGGRGVQTNAYALRTGGGGSKIGKFLRTYFMDGPKVFNTLDDYADHRCAKPLAHVGKGKYMFLTGKYMLLTL